MYSTVLVGHSTKPAGQMGPEPESKAAGPEESSMEVRGLQFLFDDSAARIIADDSGKVLWVTASATSIAAENLCLSITDGSLTGRTRHSERLLRELLSDAKASQGPVEQLIARAANEVPELFVQAHCPQSVKEPVVALTIRRLQRQLDHLPDLNRLYGLTPTEQQIIGLMVQGRSVTEIAAELHKSVLTVRTHIKRTYLKLNVGTKEQLFSTVMKLMLD